MSALKGVMVAMAKNMRKFPLAARLARWRVWVQSAFLLAWLDPLMLRLHTVCGPVFHCHSCPLATFACPIGVLAHFGALHVFPLLAVGTLVVVGALLGTFICGWVCPFGLVQDLAGRAPTPKLRPPQWMTHFRFVVLGALVLAIPIFFGEEHPLFICRVCPAGAVGAAVPHTASTALSGGPIAWPSLTKSIILVVFVGGIFFVERPWCRFFCPLGAIFSLTNRASVFFMRFDAPRCRDCTLCEKRCRYGVDAKDRVDSAQCIRCLDCTQCDVITVDHVFAARKPEALPAGGGDDSNAA